MMGRSHVIAGVSTGVAVATLNPELTIPVLAASLIGSIAPDIDHTKSTMGKILFPVSIIMVCLLRVEHRGITHSGAVALLLIAASVFIDNCIMYGFTVGYISHLFMDLLTEGGIPLSWPKKKRTSCFYLCSYVLFILFYLTSSPP